MMEVGGRPRPPSFFGWAHERHMLAQIRWYASIFGSDEWRHRLILRRPSKSRIQTKHAEMPVFCACKRRHFVRAVPQGKLQVLNPGAADYFLCFSNRTSPSGRSATGFQPSAL